MPVPEGIISTSTGPVDPNAEVQVVEPEDFAIAAELVEEELPEVEDEAQVEE